MNFANLIQSLFEEDEFDDSPPIHPDEPDSSLTDDLPFQRKRKSRTQDLYQTTNLIISIPELDIERKVTFNIEKSGSNYISTIIQNWGLEEGEEQINVHPSKFAALSFVRDYKKDIIDALKNAIDDLDSQEQVLGTQSIY